ncbi:MAG TPA: alpha/beta hydrolase [Solirubrobacteraceae bacterium]|nr:alpha/beta hydrolase [Solirubrobacteraceae bacterium]
MTDEPHRWRSPLLGEQAEIELEHGRLQLFRRGGGPPLVFAHGWLANANLWRKVVEPLADRFTCVTLDLPFGGHRVALDEHADLSAAGCGALIADALEALELTDVTLIGNDSGGAYSQIATAARPERVAKLVLNSCETPYDSFPPPPFDGLPAAAADPAVLEQLFGALRDRAIRATPPAYGLLIKHPIDDVVSDSYALPCLHDAGVLRDTAKVMSGASTEQVHQAGSRLIEHFDRPVLFAWSPEDRVFPVEHAQHYANALRSGHVELIEDAYSFTPEDQPERLAGAIATFALTATP